MQRQRIIDRFVMLVEPEIFGYKKVYLLITGIDIEESNKEGEKVYRTLREAGEIMEHRVCVGQINQFGLLVRENEVEEKISILKSNTELSLTILGIRESGRALSHSKELIETDYKLMHFLLKNPRAKVEDLAKAAGITTKTVKRRLDKLMQDQAIMFRPIFRPEALRGYLMFYVLLNVRHENSSRVLQRIRARHETYLFSEPIVQSSVIFLTLFSENIYELDRVYRLILRASPEIEKSWLFIDIDVKVYQAWLSNELEKKLKKARQTNFKSTYRKP